MNPNLESTTKSVLQSGIDRAGLLRHEALQATSLMAYMTERMASGGIVAATRAILDMQFDALAACADVVKGEREPLDVAGELGSRTRSGLRFEALIQTMGKELFGSARPAGETQIGEDAHYRLSYFPPKAGVPEQPALFHVGGVLPYGDALFRMLPEACFFDRFTSRGMPVYALELRGDKDHSDFHDLTLEGVVDAISHFSGVAFDHGKSKKMVLEGYCGLASQVLAYAAAKPLECNARFKVVANFVGPVDGTKCKGLSEIMQLMPHSMVEASMRMAERTGDYVSGDQLRTTQDIALKGFLGKTPLGRFAAGWKKPEYAAVDGIDSLTPDMRKDLAGAYWISPENCRRWPVPPNLSRYTSGLFTDGVGQGGELPGSYRGRPLKLTDAVEGTQLQFVSFYGGKDALVPEATAEPLKRLFGERYKHVVHPAAGHVSYILSPNVWDKANPKALTPNPVDVILERLLAP
ncbi:MAG TPA: hypothetical protein VGK67_19315 [Myxococcales bacterium]|jgi:hypothetical protein